MFSGITKTWEREWKCSSFGGKMIDALEFSNDEF